MPDWLFGAAGTVLILFSGLCFVAAGWRQANRVAPPKQDTNGCRHGC